jgi:hypothetical protein
MFGTEAPDLVVDLLPNAARLVQSIFMRSGELRRIRERPMQSRRHPGENRTALGLRFIANGDHVGEQLSGFEDVEHGARFVFGNIDPTLVERFDRERIEFARLQAGAFRFKEFAAPFVQQRRRHLAARAVVHANEENFLFHCAFRLSGFSAVKKLFHFRHLNVTNRVSFRL